MSETLKGLLAAGNNGQYYHFENKKSYNDPKFLKMYENKIRKYLSNTSNARWDLALTIALLLRSGAWTNFHDETLKLYDQWDKDNPTAKTSDNPYGPIGGYWYAVNSIYFLTFLKEKFGLGRTTVYNYLEVVDKFATYVNDEKDKEPEYKIREEAKHFHFWQLVEMLSLTYEERLKVQPNWTREEIRAYKKLLREKKSDKIQPAEQVEAEEKPMTEAQQRFAKYSKDDLINLVVELEEACNQNKLEVERILACPVTVSDVLPLKQELTVVIEKQLKSYNYEIHLHGRKQGVKAFAGVLAKRIIESCSSNDEENNFENKPCSA